MYFSVSVHCTGSVHVFVLSRCSEEWWLCDVAVTLLRQIVQSHGEISRPQECQHWGLDYHLPQCITLYITIQ